MIKLYKRIEGVLHYHEAWCDNGMLTEHWGVVGEKGSIKEYRIPSFKSESAFILEVLQTPLKAGYAELEDDPSIVLIEFLVDGHGSSDDLDKRYALQSRMDQTLGWTGLGHCDGGSMGSGTMEVCCFVVDAEIAKRVIADDLKDTVFSDFSRIYEE